jgi:stage III sporulation protein SpoIIIAA
MSPEIIVTDEVFGADEINAIADICRAGVKVFATVHAKNASELAKHPLYSGLLPHFLHIVTLSRTPKVGTVTEIIC